jgi:hypothetical protein
VRVHLVGGADLRVPVAERRVGELERDVRIVLVDRIQLRTVGEQVGGQLRADQPGQVLAQDHVLVVPRQRPARLLESTLLLDQSIVHSDQRDRHLAGEQLHVVARIADQRDALVIARDVDARGREQELGRIVLAVQVRRADRARAVQALEIRPRRTRVAKPADVGMMDQR